MKKRAAMSQTLKVLVVDDEAAMRMVLEMQTLGLPMVLALNMMDQARQRGIAIDIAKLQAELAKVVALPDVQARLRGLGGEPGGMTVEQFTRYNAQEYERFGRLIREAGIKPE